MAEGDLVDRVLVGGVLVGGVLVGGVLVGGVLVGGVLVNRAGTVGQRRVVVRLARVRASLDSGRRCGRFVVGRHVVGRHIVAEALASNARDVRTGRAILDLPVEDGVLRLGVVRLGVVRLSNVGLDTVRLDTVRLGGDRLGVVLGSLGGLGGHVIVGLLGVGRVGAARLHRRPSGRGDTLHRSRGGARRNGLVVLVRSGAVGHRLPCGSSTC
ncbi:hypothetical protein [Cellulomonas soli]